MPELRIGGSFAPPLDAERLAAYKGLAAALPAHVADAVNGLIVMAERFQETPRSALRGLPHPSGAPIAVVPLEEQEVRRVWDVVPWDGQALPDGGRAPRECDMMAEAFDQLDREATRRNGERILAWQAAVVARLTAKHFPEPGLFPRVVRALRAAAAWAGLMTKDQEAKVAEYREPAEACRAEIGAAFAAKDCEGLPYPELEPTPARNAAFHLLWYAKELSADREPLCSNFLRPPPAGGAQGPPPPGGP